MLGDIFMFEIIGIIASVLVVISALSKTTTYKGTVWLRVTNTLGSVFFIIYGAALGAWSTMMCNIGMFIISIIYLCIEMKGHKKKMYNNNDVNN
jgi:hypothetical protein